MAEQKTIKPKYNVRNSLVSYYLLFMFTLFPLFLTNQYAHARTDKLYYYLVLSGILVIAVAAVSVSYASENRRTGVQERSLLPLTAPDIAFLCFFCAAAISTLFSSHRLAALTGAAGRNNGLILLLTYTLVYFTVSRFYRYKEYVLIAYLVFSCIVALLTVLNFFYIDPFNLLSGYAEDIIEDFGSTIGNKNTIASFMCIFLPAAMAMFTVSKKRYIRILSGVSIALAYTGLLCADSNSGFLGLAAILATLLIFSARRYSTLTRYTLALAVMFLSGKALRLFSLALGDRSKTFEPIPYALIYSRIAYVPPVICAALFVLLLLLRRRAEPHYHGRVLPWVFAAVAGIIAAAVLGAFVYYSVIDTDSELGAWTRILRFDDRWGTHRGFMWIRGLQEFGGFSLFYKLFGSGPDTFYYVFEPHFAELLARFGDSSTDCIHSEYLNYLVTQGIIGLISYLGILVTVIVRSARTARRHPLAIIFICAVIGYAAQAAVNIYQPITTPTMLLFLSMAEALNRYNDEELMKIEL